jgi:hypothetical protein
VQEEVPSETAKSDSKVQVGARARETTPSAAIASLPASLTEGDRIAQARAAALLLGTRIQRHLSGPSLWHQAPKSLEEARAHHHGAAGHWEAQLLQGLRLSWGYGVHLPAKGAGHLLDWLTSSPVITVSALLIYTACHYWLLHWLPWF